MLGVRRRLWGGMTGVGRDLLPVGRQRSQLMEARDTTGFCIQFNSDIYIPETFKNTCLTVLIQVWELKEKAPAFRTEKEMATLSSPSPVFLPGESCGRRSLVGCHLWGRTESDTTERLN